ncbi:MAG: copper resistance protein CopC, partial [Bacillus sp. (in: Bacteria)]|nr:copper resistance protein CopC [Bacillus sp. (in: firmicutes)]
KKIMKKIVFILISMLVMIPSISSAHTELTSSNSATSQVLTVDIKEIVLTYEGEIESLSMLKLVEDGKEIPLVSVEPRGQTTRCTLLTPLENGS